MGIIPTLAISVVLSVLVKYLLQNVHLRPLIVCFSSVMLVGISIYTLGISKPERLLINNKIQLLFKVIRNWNE